MDSYPGFSISIYVTITIDDELNHRFYWRNGDSILWSHEKIAPHILPEEAIRMDSLFRQFLNEMPNETRKTIKFQLRIGGVDETFPKHREDVIVTVSKIASGSLNFSY